jgi:transcriptional regulator with XRE-family HTH domain
VDSTNFFKNFGVNLAKIRQGKNISAYELSLRVGKDASYIHKVETGKINISVRSLFEICNQLQVEPADLFAIDSESQYTQHNF